MTNATIAAKYITNPLSAWTGVEKIPLDVGGADGVGLASTLKTYVNSGERVKLAADTNYYVATTGNDATGTGAVGAPWASPQKAWNWIVANLDLAGFAATVNLAAGTYEPLVAGTPVVKLTGTPVGGGPVVFKGQAGNRTSVRFYSSTAADGKLIVGDGDFQSVQFWYIQLFQRADQTNYGSATYFWNFSGSYYFYSCDLGTAASSWYVAGNVCLVQVDGTYSILGDNLGGGFTASDGGVILHYANCDIPNSVTIGSAWPEYYALFNVYGSGSYITVYPTLFSNGGNLTGMKYHIGAGAWINVASGSAAAVHLSDIPGSLTGVADIAGFAYIGAADWAVNQSMIGMTEKVGLPTTTELDPSCWGIFKNTSDAKVYLAINDGGVIKKVELT